MEPMTLSRLDPFDDIAVRLDNVSLRYDTSDDVLSGIDLSLKQGSFTFLTGASGAGKSSLLKLLYLALKPTRGEVSLFGRPTGRLARDQLSALRRRVGVVFQEFRLLPHLSAFDNVALPLRILGRPEKEIRSNVTELLEWVGLGDHKMMLPPTMSGGQQQRTAIARAVIARPKLLLADEPTGNLDDEIGFRLMTLFEQLNRMGTTIVIATHSQTIMDQFGHPRLVLEHGGLRVEEPKNWIRRKIEGVF